MFECVGEGSICSAIHACKQGATIVVLGVFGHDVWADSGLGITDCGSLMYVGDDYQEAFRLLANGQISIEHIVAHRYPLDGANKAFSKALERGNVLKVLLQN